MASLLIKDTFDTARMTAFCRALESERKNACMHDPYARLLAGERGEEIVGKMGGKSITWPIAVRTCVYDEIIMRLATQQEIDTVINLAAGLDTRPYRLALPSSLTWIEVDFPNVLAYKQKQLAQEQTTCELERVALGPGSPGVSGESRQASKACAGTDRRATRLLNSGESRLNRN